MSNNMRIWNAVKRPPESALKQIKGGRLAGMTDIKPQWRYEAMTDLFGPVGDGWKFEIIDAHTELGSEDQLMCFVSVNLYYKKELGEWSAPIPGIGGSMLITKESKGLHSSDEGYKMALTDALSVAMKPLGVGAEIYFGNFDGTKYKDKPTEKTSVEPDQESARLLRSADSMPMLQDIWKSLTQEQRESSHSIKDEMKLKLEGK